jgi:hypothetical protein
MNAVSIESFHQGDGEEFYYKYLHEHGWIQLWRPAPYHWVAMNIKGRSILSYTEGDVSKTMYPDEDSFMKALQDTKDWWVKYQGKSANPVLCGNAEPYGFLTGDPINLDPPRCETHKKLMYPNSNGGGYVCLSCKYPL